MKHFKKLFMLLVLILILAACTGTPAPTAPLFVIAGIEANKILVFQDRTLDGLREEEPRFSKFAEATLEASPIAFDSVEENSGRSELVVLSRSQAPNNGVVSTYLNFFNTRGLDPDQPDTFRPSRNRVDLKGLTYPANFGVDTLCPIDMEINNLGTQAIIFSSPRICFPESSDANEAMIVVTLPAKLPATTPASVPSIIRSATLPANPFVKTAISNNGLLRAAMYLDRSSDTLYYLREKGTQNVDLLSLSSTAYLSGTPETGSNSSQRILENVQLAPDQFRDIGKVSSSIVLLDNSDYLLAPLTPPTPPIPIIRPVETVDALSTTFRALVADDTELRLLILDSNERLIYHADPTNTASTQTDIDGTVSAWNTTDNFLYIAGSNAQGQGFFNIIDTLPFNEDNTNLGQLRAEETCADSPAICEMVNPTALSWVQGILLPETEQ
jgi:hypothetical protein